MGDAGAFYKLGFELAFRVHSGQKTAGIGAELLSAVLKKLPSNTEEGDAEDKRTDKDPKDPDDSQTWSASGPFGGDNMSAMGLVPEAVADAGY